MCRLRGAGIFPFQRICVLGVSVNVLTARALRTVTVPGKRHLRRSLKAHDVKLQKRLFESTINGGQKMEEVLKDKRILIVDDEPDILETLKELLDFALKRQHCNIIFLRGFADMGKKMGTYSFHEFKCA